MSEIKLTTRGRYAITAMIEIAGATQDRPTPLSNIANKSNISLSYLEQLIAGLRRHGLVKSYRGPGGGYILAHQPSEIIIADILMAAEDSAPARRGTKNEQKSSSCAHTHALWTHIGKSLHVILNDLSLADIIRGQFEQPQQKTPKTLGF